MTQLTKKQKKEAAKANKRIRQYVPIEIYLQLHKGHRVLNKNLPGLAVDIWIRLNQLSKEQIKGKILYLDASSFTQYLEILNKEYFNGAPTKVRPDKIEIAIYGTTYQIKEDPISKAEREVAEQKTKQQNEQSKIQNKEEGAESSNIQGNT